MAWETDTVAARRAGASSTRAALSPRAGINGEAHLTLPAKVRAPPPRRLSSPRGARGTQIANPLQHVSMCACAPFRALRRPVAASPLDDAEEPATHHTCTHSTLY